MKKSLLALASLAFLGLLGGSLLLFFLLGAAHRGRILHERDEVQATEVRLKDSWHLDTLGSLVVLEDAADGTRGGTESGVQHVHVLLFGVSLLSTGRVNSVK